MGASLYQRYLAISRAEKIAEKADGFLGVDRARLTLGGSSLHGWQREEPELFDGRRAVVLDFPTMRASVEIDAAIGRGAKRVYVPYSYDVKGQSGALAAAKAFVSAMSVSSDLVLAFGENDRFFKGVAFAHPGGFALITPPMTDDASASRLTNMVKSLALKVDYLREDVKRLGA